MRAGKFYFLIKGGQGSGNFGHKGRTGKVGGSAENDEVASIKEALVTHAVPWRHLAFSKEAWEREFPKGGVETPIQFVKLGENQIEKLVARKRELFFGLIKPTLKDPQYIVSVRESPEKIQERKDKGENVERDTVLHFIKPFRKMDEDEVQCFCCVSINREGVEISISASPRKIKQVVNLIRKNEVIYQSGKAATTHAPKRRSTVTDDAASSGRGSDLAKAATCLYFITEIIESNPKYGLSPRPF